MSSLKSTKFRKDREESWKKLELLLGKLESKSLTSLSDEEMIALPALYRSALSSLSVARATSLDQDVIKYLENLSTRAYFAVYGNKTGFFTRVKRFFLYIWPNSVRSIWRETIASVLLMFLGAALAYILVSNNMDWYFSFMPDSLAQGRTPAASAEELRKYLYHDDDANGLAVFASFLFSHNSRVAILAFALGFAFAIPSLILMIYNGIILGAFFALHVEKGLGFELGGWLIIHGATELFAICLAGAAGIKIGWSVAFPGYISRLDAIANAGRNMAAVLGGVIIMLFCAGLLEGFGRQLITNDYIRYLIGIVTLILWLGYFYLPRDEVLSDFESDENG